MDTLKIAERLSDSGIKPSLARVNIYYYLRESEDHPTVDVIYNDLVNTIPTLSKTTVYNTLKLFIDKDLVKSLNLYENEKRYDIINDNHSHFLCVECERIYDIPYEDADLLPEGYGDFKIKEKQIILKGVCPKCVG